MASNGQCGQVDALYEHLYSCEFQRNRMFFGDLLKAPTHGLIISGSGVRVPLGPPIKSITCSDSENPKYHTTCFGNCAVC